MSFQIPNMGQGVRTKGCRNRTQHKARTSARLGFHPWLITVK